MTMTATPVRILVDTSGMDPDVVYPGDCHDVWADSVDELDAFLDAHHLNESVIPTGQTAAPLMCVCRHPRSAHSTVAPGACGACVDPVEGDVCECDAFVSQPNPNKEVA